MSFLLYVALLGWLPFTLALYSWIRPRTAAFTSLVLGYLFLPQAGLPVAGMIDLSRNVAISASLLVGMLAFDAGRLRGLRFRWFDLPIFVWILAAFPTSLSNGLGWWDGLSGFVQSLTTYGIPYLVGRAYVRTHEDARAFAAILLVGGLLYVPLCLYEARMSPQLHRMVYGFHQHVFAQAKRLGGWRPTVFLQHGLAVGVWTASMALLGLWAWRARQLRHVLGVPMGLAALLLTGTALLCNSLGAMLLLMLGAATLVFCGLMKSKWPLVALVLMPAVYLSLRIVQDWRAEPVVRFVAMFDETRATSLEGRVRADVRLRDHALKRPSFGWGGYNRFREGLGAVLPDSLWAITLGQRGLLGLFSLFGFLVLAPLLALLRVRGPPRRGQSAAIVIGLAATMALYNLDCMVNAMISPVFAAMAGALIAVQASPVSPAQLRARASRGG